MFTNRKSRMKIMFPIAYALEDFWYNLTFYGDLFFTLVTTLFILTMTHLIAWSRKSELDEEEETQDRDSEGGSEDESDRSEDSVEEEFGTSLCEERRRRLARLVAGVQWHHRGRRFRPRRD